VCNIVQRGQIRPSHARDVDRYLQNLRAVAPTKGCKERGMGQAPLMEQQNEVLKRTAVFEGSNLRFRILVFFLLKYCTYGASSAF